MMEGTSHTLAVAPLVSDQADPEHGWLGASLGKLLTEHLAGAGLPVRHYNAVGEATLKLDKVLPLDEKGAEAVMQHLQLSTLVVGGFHLDTRAGQLHLSLTVTSKGTAPAPLTDSAPTTAFAQQIERVTLALIEQLDLPVDDKLRRRVSQVPRPHSFRAFQQLARARAAWAEEEFALALSLVESALELEPKLEEAAEIKIGVGRAADRMEVVREGFELWAELAGRNERPLARAERLLLFGHWLVDQAAWGVAEGTYRAALNVYQQEGHRLGEAQALDNLAGLALRRGRAEEAIETYRKSIAVYEMLGAAQEVATTTFNLALGHKALGESEAALDALDRVLSSARDLKDPGLEAAAHDQRGTIQALEGDSNSAQADYERAVRLYEAQEDALGLATVKDHLATLVAERGDYAAAEALRLEAIALFEKLGDEHELAVVWTNLAALYVEMGAYEQAWDYAQQAHAIFERLGSAMQQVTAELLAGMS